MYQLLFYLEKLLLITIQEIHYKITTKFGINMSVRISLLKKCFGNKIAVDIPDFTISDGELIGIVGNNGAGKTTLFRLILDLIETNEGHIYINDENSAESENWKTFTGAFIDDSFLIDFLTPEEYFEFIAKVNGINQTTLQRRLERFSSFMANEILGQSKLIRDFSAGNKQKIGIISSFINMPQLLILDEPFNYLDPSSQNILMDILTNYNREIGATILVSSHNLQHTINISSRIALMESGKIIKDLKNTDGNMCEELEEYFRT